MVHKKPVHFWKMAIGLNFLIGVLFAQPAFALQVDTTSVGISVKVAPGELLPMSIKLLNFGGGQKIDVQITYGIFDSQGGKIYSTTETVAVETTANFVKTVQIPFGTPPGRYVAKTSIAYQGQLVPANTQFDFTVENKLFGLFQSDFYFYGALALLIAIALILAGRFFAKHRKLTRMEPLDYSNVPDAQRAFFELLSDTIMNMRRRVGDVAIDIAAGINGLAIDQKTGRILKIEDDPAKIIALLVSGYDKVLGKKVSFSLRRSSSAT